MYVCPSKVISIHAPREGGDRGLEDHPGVKHISIHAPREGGDAWLWRRGS